MSIQNPELICLLFYFKNAVRSIASKHQNQIVKNTSLKRSSANGADLDASNIDALIFCSTIGCGENNFLDAGVFKLEPPKLLPVGNRWLTGWFNNSGYSLEWWGCSIGNEQRSTTYT